MHIDKSLEQFQSLVDGYFEYVMVFADTAIIFNEEGRIRHMPSSMRASVAYCRLGAPVSKIAGSSSFNRARSFAS